MNCQKCGSEMYYVYEWVCPMCEENEDRNLLKPVNCNHDRNRDKPTQEPPNPSLHLQLS